jgi:transposase
VPAIPPYIIEPVWQQFEALLPERQIGHPPGCHRSRIPDKEGRLREAGWGVGVRLRLPEDRRWLLLGDHPQA